MRSLHRIRLRGVCVSCARVGAAECFPSPNDMTEPCDAPISDCGLGPAWSMPSCRTATTEDGDAVARSSRSRIFGCKPSPRAAANVLNRSDVVISRAPTSCCCVINLNEQHCGIAPFLAFQLASLATTVLYGISVEVSAISTPRQRCVPDGLVGQSPVATRRAWHVRAINGRRAAVSVFAGSTRRRCLPFVLPTPELT
jgi:hypothetical protein